MMKMSFVASKLSPVENKVQNLKLSFDSDVRKSASQNRVFKFNYRLQLHYCLPNIKILLDLAATFHINLNNEIIQHNNVPG